uniref:F-box associated beta-propeller type 1 domain-containing protein n=1 Tax=Quercus lobata TaxID=97700 RepID=A0A7N2L4G2_QUELO
MEIPHPKPHLHFQPSPPSPTTFFSSGSALSLSPKQSKNGTESETKKKSMFYIGTTTPISINTPALTTFLFMAKALLEYSAWLVVRFVTPEDGDFEEGKSTPKVEIYSLATGKWRVVTAQCPKCAVRDTMLVCLRLQAFVNGALHLVCYKTTQEIRFLYFVLVFDLEDEVFREIPLPKHSDMLYWEWVSIMAFGNSIALLEPGYAFHTLDLWVLKNYADASSWTKIISLNAQAPPQDISRPFHYREKIPCAKAFRKSGEVRAKFGI